MTPSYRYLIKPMRPGSQWTECLLDDIAKRDTDITPFATYHRILRLETVNFNARTADRMFKEAEQSAELIIMPLAHPRFHGDEDYPLMLVEYANLLATDQRTIVVYDMLTLANDGQEGRHPINGPAVERLIAFWKMLHRDRVMERREFVEHVAELSQLQAA